MSQWPGFDSRKVCPQCGGYQTRLWRYKRSPVAAPRRLLGLFFLAFLALLLLLIFFITLIIRHTLPEPYQVISLLFIVLMGLGSILLNHKVQRTLLNLLKRRGRESDLTPDAANLDHPSVGYGLQCLNCGYKWEKTAEEWEKEGQKEVEERINHPASVPPSDEEMIEDQGKIEWQPANPARGIFLVAAVVIIFLLVSAALYGALWSTTHPNADYAFLISGITIGFMLLILIGLVFIRKFKPARIIPVILIVLIVIVLRFFVK